MVSGRLFWRGEASQPQACRKTGILGGQHLPAASLCKQARAPLQKNRTITGQESVRVATVHTGSFLNWVQPATRMSHVCRHVWGSACTSSEIHLYCCLIPLQTDFRFRKRKKQWVLCTPWISSSEAKPTSCTQACIQTRIHGLPAPSPMS